jgi:hypothetical protein
MTRSGQNRPFKYGDRDRREFIVQDSEVSLICINDTTGSPIFIGRAKPGVLLSEDKWQIEFITYDSNQGVTRGRWPQNDEGNASSEYEFVWDLNSPLTITNITQANPAVVTVSSIGSLQNGDQIAIVDVQGMTEVNLDGPATNIFTVANILGATFELSGIDSTAFTAYSSGGLVQYGNVLQLTYS